MATFGRIFGRGSTAAVGMAALFILMGAKGEGCFGGGGGGGEGGGDPEPPPPAECPPGMHAELVCDDHGCDDDPWMDDGPNEGGGAEASWYDDQPPTVPGDCEEICVPDDVCPEGSYEELVCNGGPEPPPPTGGGGGICLSPEGCGQGGEPGYPDYPDQGWEEECFSVCVPYDECGPGHHEEWVCEEPEPYPGPCLSPGGCQGEPGDPGPEECFPICVPDGEICPPGMEPDSQCDEYGCWEECLPNGGECPPELLPMTVCDENGCWDECVPYEEAPPQ
jgi:hypothetical protein